MTRRTPEQIQWEIDLLKGEQREIFEHENHIAKKTLMTFGFTYKELIPIVVKYEKLLHEVRTRMALEASKLPQEAI